MSGWNPRLVCGDDRPAVRDGPAAGGGGPVYANAAPAQAIIASSLLRYTGEVMDACPQLKLIARTGIGVDNVDLGRGHGTRDRRHQHARRPDRIHRRTHRRHAAGAGEAATGRRQPGRGALGPRSGVFMGDEVQGKTLGLVGLGRIGHNVAQICGLGLNMRAGLP